MRGRPAPRSRCRSARFTRSSAARSTRARSSSSTASPITRRPPSRSSSTSPRPPRRRAMAARLRPLIVGHDWGGAITYTVCAAAPSHVRRAVTLAIPHPATLIRSLASSKQWKKSWYMGLFQLPGAGYLVGRRELALIDRLWRAWSPSFTLDSARRDELHACLQRSLPHRSSTTVRSCTRSRRSSIACARPRRTL